MTLIKVRLCLTLELDLQLDLKAKLTGKTRSEIVREALQLYFSAGDYQKGVPVEEYEVLEVEEPPLQETLPIQEPDEDEELLDYDADDSDEDEIIEDD